MNSATLCTAGSVTVLMGVLLVLLNTTEELSYLPILQLTEDIASDADFHVIVNPNPVFIAQQSDLDSWNSMSNAEIANPYRAQNASPPYFPFIRLEDVDDWLGKQPMVKGYSPRWILPNRIKPRADLALDAFLFVIDQARELEVGLGRLGTLPTLKGNEVVVSKMTAEIIGKTVGEEAVLSFGLEDFVNQKNTLNKYFDVESAQDPDRQIETQDLSQLISEESVRKLLKEAGLLDQDNLVLQYLLNEFLSKAVEAVRTESFEVKVRIKGIVDSNSGLWPNQLRNAVVADHTFLPIIVRRVLRELRNAVLKDSFFNLFPFEDTYSLEKAVLEYSPFVAVAIHNRTTLYDPRNNQIRTMLAPILKNTPPQFDVLPFAPLYFVSSKLALFFQAVLQIYTVLLSIIYLQLVWSLIDTHYRRRSNDIRLMRMIGYGAHKGAGRLPYRLMDLPFWGCTLLLTSLVMVAVRLAFTHWILQQYKLEFVVPSLWRVLLFVLFLLAGVGYGVYKGLGGILSGVPKGNSFAAPKVKVTRVDEAGLGGIWMLVGTVLLAYGITAFILIPQATFNQDDQASTSLFNFIFFMMYLGIVTLLNLVQSPIEMLLGKVATLLPCLRPLRSIIYAHQRANKFQYKYIALAFSLVFAFLIFFNNGMEIQLTLVSSILKRIVGADVKFEKSTGLLMNRSTLDPLLQSLKARGSIHGYTWKADRNMDDNYLYNIKIKNAINGDQMQIPVVLDRNFLNVTFSEYYIPKEYEYTAGLAKLSTGQYDAFQMLNYSESVSRLVQMDPFNLIPLKPETYKDKKADGDVLLAIAAEPLMKLLGGKTGQEFVISNELCFARIKVVHVLEMLPSYEDQMGRKLFFSEPEMRRLRSICSPLARVSDQLKYTELFLKVDYKRVEESISTVLQNSPPHTVVVSAYEVDEGFKRIKSMLQTILTTTTVLCLLLQLIMMTHSISSKLVVDPQPHYLLRAIGLRLEQTVFYFLTELYIEIFTAAGLGIAVGFANSVVWGKMVSDLLKVNLDISSGFGLVALFILFVAAVGWLSVKIATRSMARQSIAKNVK